MSAKCTVEKQNHLLRLTESLMTDTTTNKQKVFCLGLLTGVQKILKKKVLDTKLYLVTKVYFCLTIYPVLAWLLSNFFENMKI